VVFINPLPQPLHGLTDAQVNLALSGFAIGHGLGYWYRKLILGDWVRHVVPAICTDPMDAPTIAATVETWLGEV